MQNIVNQYKDGGANPTPSLQFSRVALKDISKFVKANHYSKTHPGGCDFSFGCFRDNYLVGAAMFGHMAGNPKAMCVLTGYNDPNKFRELMRLVLLDEVPKNSESQFIGWCLRYLKKETDLLALISFADPKYGHSGIIYRASNWIYTGLQKQDRPRIIVDGTEFHPRECYDKFGTSSVKKIVALGHFVETRPREPKHRYVYLLQKNLKPLLKYPEISWKINEQT